MDFISVFNQYKEVSISGRYINNSHIEPLLSILKDNFKVEILGYSVNKKPIYSIKLGTGKIKIFMWSQMHGNESTTTKALFDLFNYLRSDSVEANSILEHFTLLCIPILNPDGAEVYTRVNANQIDLNRDSVDLSQPESQLLRKSFEEFQPDYCYNLHDQRSIFAAGDTKNPATVSFLAPSFNDSCDYNDVRLKAVEIIIEMNNELQKHIPNQVGRFDDSFNINCIGDMFQSLGVPTILFEAGHFQNDYKREETRKFIFISYLSSLNYIKSKLKNTPQIDLYLNIPQNKVNFYDFIYKKIRLNTDSLNLITNFAAHYNEVLVGDKIVFEAKIVEVNENIIRNGHQEFDLESGIYYDNSNNVPEIEQIADFKVDDVCFINGQKTV
ncbi:MAG: M14 family metallopeptidase [Limnohabitans sp.]|nr:M14 family metallopeptidase [Limnohabitans sp.]